MGLPSRNEVSRTGRTSTKDPGKKARTLPTSTVKPPFTHSVIMPITV